MRRPMRKRDAQRNDAAAARVARVASRQEGVVAEPQLRALGMDRFTVARWVRSGRLHRIYPGVYAVGHRAVGARGMLLAGLFHGGPGAALSHSSAAHAWGLITEAPLRIHISVPRRTEPATGLVLHHPRRLERVVRDGLPVTPVARTLVDLASITTPLEIRKALAEADFRDLLDLGELAEVMRPGRPGSARLRAAAEAHLPQLALTRSRLEDELLLLCERHCIPTPEPNARVGPYRVDALWRAERVIVELDGRAAHSSEARRLTDHRRDLDLRRRGYIVRRYGWFQVVSTPEAVAADLRSTLAARRAAAEA